MTDDSQRRVLTLNCSTCGATGITVWEDHVSACPGPGEIAVTRQLGRGLIVTAAPPRARMTLALLAEHGYGLSMVGTDQINIADQALYQVVGYDAESAALLLELVEDWRPTPTAVLSEVDVEALKARWLEAHGKPGTAHVVTEIHTADHQPVPGFRPFAPAHIPKTGDPADALVVQPYDADNGGTERWVFRCWGTDSCDGWLSLDHYSQQSAERARDRHVAEEHAQEQPVPGPDNPPVECWHTEPDTPCDWDVCRQPERLAAGDRGTDPARKEPPNA